MLRTEHADGTKTPLERAFELARSGRFETARDIRTALDGEGYSVAQITGRTLTVQLSEEIQKARRACSNRTD